MNPLSKNLRQLLIWVLVFFLLLALFQNLKQAGTEKEIPYSEFKEKLQENRILDLTMRPDLIHGEFKDDKGGSQNFHTIPLPDPNLVQELENMQFQYQQADPQHRDALADIILHRSADVQPDALTPELNSFIARLRAERTHPNKEIR